MYLRRGEKGKKSVYENKIIRNVNIVMGWKNVESIEWFGADWASHVVCCVRRLNACIYRSNSYLHALLQRSDARNVNIGFYANDSVTEPDWRAGRERANERQNEGRNKNMGKAFVDERKRRISQMPVFSVDAWCSPPQNNVSMFFKWNFVGLLMRVPIKLHSLQCCGFVYVSRRTKRLWKKNIEIRHITSCFDATISQELSVCFLT